MVADIYLAQYWDNFAGIWAAPCNPPEDCLYPSKAAAMADLRAMLAADGEVYAAYSPQIRAIKLEGGTLYCEVCEDTVPDDSCGHPLIHIPHELSARVAGGLAMTDGQAAAEAAEALAAATAARARAKES